MATVRIYKVAELLGTTSQEVLALLKRDHGIELKSASSSLEEVVARSFVERLARQRNVALPGGDMFSDAPAPAKGGKKAVATKKVEPPKPAAPTLGPPRLVKVVKPLAPPPPAEEPHVEAEPLVAPVPEIAEEPEAPAAIVAEPVEVIEEPTPEPPPVAVSEETPGVVDSPPTPAEAPAPAPGRFVPPTLRLRIEEPGRVPQPARPLAPAKRPQIGQQRMVKPAAPAGTPRAPRP